MIQPLIQQPHNVTTIFLLKQIKFKVTVTDATTSATDVTQDNL
jgi:hypothetical protein